MDKNEIMFSVSEIFSSIQGEGTAAGLPFSFIRLCGCNLNCAYCDTKYARTSGDELPLTEILKRVDRLQINNVLLTGGEPLVNPHIGDLAEALYKSGKNVFVETNGSISLDKINLTHIARFIMDVKTPGSGHGDSFLSDNLRLLRKHDEIKFVITSKSDFDWSLELLRTKDFPRSNPIIFQAAVGALLPADLAAWIIANPLACRDVRLGVQLHKIIWPDKNKGF